VHESDTGFSLHASSSASVIDYLGFLSILTDVDDAIHDLVHNPNGPSCDPALPDSSTRDTPAKGNQQTSTLNDGDLGPQQNRLLEILESFTGLPSNVVRSSSATLTSLGIDSISAVQVAGLLRKNTIKTSSGHQITAADVARSKTVGELLALLASSSTTTLVSTPSIQPPPSWVVDQVHQFIPQEFIESIKPITPGMEWYIGGWQERFGRWHRHTFAFSLQRKLDQAEEKAFKAAWASWVSHHPILRSGIVRLTMEPEKEHSWKFALCTYRDASSLSVERLLHSSGSSETEVIQLQRIASGLRVPQAPLHEPLTRATLVRGRNSSYFLVGLHHVQYGEYKVSNSLIFGLMPRQTLSAFGMS
jgi:ferricrocin synthase